MPPVGITGLEALQQSCPSQPPVLTDAQIAELLAHYPDAQDRERQFWAQRDLQHRACELFERNRANAVLAAVGRYNQIVDGH